MAFAGVAVLLWGSPPGYFDRKPAIAAYFNHHHQQIVTATYVDMLAGFFLLWFLAVLRGRLRAHEGPAGRFADLALVGGAASIALVWVSDALVYAGAERAAQPGPITPASAATLYDTSQTLMQPAAIGLAVALAATAVVSVRFRALPPWLALSAGAIAILLLTPLASIGVPVALGWILVASLALTVAEVPRIEVVVSPENGVGPPVVYRSSSTTFPVARR